MGHIGPVCQWEVFWADLEPHVGSEQAGDRRPVVVVSGNSANATFGTVTIIPLTKLEGKNRAGKFFEVPLPRGTVPNTFTPLALPHQIRSVAKIRLLSYAGRLTDADAKDRLQRGILDHLGIFHED